MHLDLNGFRIVGPVRCTGDPPATAVGCTPTGNSGFAIRVVFAAGGSPDGTVIRNGTVEGFTFAGINCAADRCVIEEIHSRHNEGFGMVVGSDTTVRDSVTTLNSGTGISGGARVLASNVRSLRNGESGARLGQGSVIENSILSRNTLRGLVTFLAVGDDAASGAYRNCVMTGNNGGNANPQAQGIALGSNICGTDDVCP